MNITITLERDGNMWGALVGPDLQEGLSAFAETPMQAIRGLGTALANATDCDLRTAVPEMPTMS